MANSNKHKGMVWAGGGGDPVRFTFMVEINPWVSQEDAEIVTLYRGAIVSAWGYIETNLSELAIRCSHVTAYRGLRDAFPTKLSGKISYLQAVLNAEGPLNSYKSFGLKFLKKFKDSEELRNQMAHGRMTIIPHWGVEFCEIVPINNSITRRIKRYKICDLAQFAKKATRLSRICQRVTNEITSKNLLPNLHEILALVSDMK